MHVRFALCFPQLLRNYRVSCAPPKLAVLRERGDPVTVILDLNPFLFGGSGPKQFLFQGNSCIYEVYMPGIVLASGVSNLDCISSQLISITWLPFKHDCSKETARF